ncbi:PRC-barrel domain-containing protein [Shinella kummerowiae]|jgi:sporulation protein YlmC with PRC-barrel domain|uniref:PRC-barrel domain containing protein n=1 Tax=Shinella kummerowiae TaxID=417745 RepID=A0A6N8SHK3_9HYPH|nr:PRC-barrel domain-containing protein [Shinella kummerowiae]MCT7663095.1 PRC-barrel domain-containing protein [Shinella kummerowiae]MXN48171.1 PRC-barrel domain containing protein [Shinella kummerowiae]
MTNKLLTSVAAGAIFLGAALAPAAYAQDTTQPAAGETQTMDKPAVMPGDDATGTTPGDTAATPGTTPTEDTAQTPATGTESQDTAETPAMTPSEDTAQAPAAGGDYLTAQSDEQISANTYIGQSVYNSADESIGKISDLIMEKDGGITAAVVGVGGFLGIGEKWVAVPFEKVSITQTPDSDDVKLTTTETAESLQAAPEFKTKSQQVAERQATTPVDTSTTSSTTDTGTAPATTQPAE